MKELKEMFPLAVSAYEYWRDKHKIHEIGFLKKILRGDSGQQILFLIFFKEVKVDDLNVEAKAFPYKESKEYQNEYIINLFAMLEDHLFFIKNKE